MTMNSKVKKPIYEPKGKVKEMMEYKIGDTVLIRAKVEDVDFDEYGQTCIVSLPWGELKARFGGAGGRKSG